MKGKIRSIFFQDIFPIVAIVIASCNHSPIIEKQIIIGGNDCDQLQSICLTKDGGFMVGGSTESAKSDEKTQDNVGIIYSDYWLIKFNSQKEIQWQKTFGGLGIDILKSISQTDDGGYIIAGESTSDSSGNKSENCRGKADIWVIKIDSIGILQWDKTIGGNGNDICNAGIQQTPDGGYFMGASSNSNSSGDKSENCRGDFDWWSIKLDSTGKIEWEKTIGGDQFEFCGGFDFANDSCIILCGNSASGISGEKTTINRGILADIWIVKLDSKGNIVWDKTIGGPNDDYSLVVKRNPTNSYIILGASKSNKGNEKTENSKGGWDYWVMKIDKDGNKIWDKTIGGNKDDGAPWGLQFTSDGNIIIGGMSMSDKSGDKTDSCRGGYDYWVVKITPDGKKIWDKTIGGNDYDELKGGIVEIEKNKYIIAGFSQSDLSGDKIQRSRGREDYWIVCLKD